MKTHTQELTDQTFSTAIGEAQTPVLVDFWATWCAPCRMIAPVVESIAETFAGRLAVGKINVDDNPQIPARFGIRGIPTMILFQDGKEIARHVGATTHESLARFVENHLAVTQN